MPGVHPLHIPPSQTVLEDKALDFLKTCKPKEYRNMKASGELKEYCQLKAEATKRLAESLISTGVFENQAWHWAIRSEILEREFD